MATTHAASLKGDGRAGRADAAVAFDSTARRPTYRLAWGAAGASSALDVAAGLGFDPDVLEDARAVLAAGKGVGGVVGGRQVGAR